MPQAVQELDRSEYDILLEVHGRLDHSLDRALVERLSLEQSLQESMSEALAYVRERRTSASPGTLLVCYRDHFERPLLVCSEPARLGELLAHLGGREAALLLSGGGPGYGFEALRVFRCPLGFALLFAEPFHRFERELLKLVARKLDTHIYQYNSLVFEQMKTLGAQEIDAVFDSDRKLADKYQAVLQLVVETIQVAGGFLVLPSQGQLHLSAGFVVRPLSAGEQACLGVAEKAWGDERHRLRTWPAGDEELLTVLLRPGARPVEGVLVLGNSVFAQAQRKLVDFYSTLIDSSIHLNRLHARVFNNFLEAIASLIDSFDSYTAGHSRRVAAYALALGEVAGLSRTELDQLRVAAMLHDIGKVGVDPELLGKRDALDEGERQLLLAHPILSERLLRRLSIDDFEDLHRVASSHHEREDGSGYPQGLAGEEIPFLTKLIIVADVFDAVTSDRPHRSGVSRDKGYAILNQEVEKGRIPLVLARRFQHPDVWARMRQDFQQAKIRSAWDRLEQAGGNLESFATEELRTRLEEANSVGVDLHEVDPDFFGKLNECLVEVSEEGLRTLLESIPDAPV